MPVFWLCDCLIDTTYKFIHRKKKRRVTGNGKSWFVFWKGFLTYIYKKIRIELILVHRPSKNSAEIRMLPHFAWCHINSKWMLERENSAECQHMSKKLCYNYKTTHDHLRISNEVVLNTFSMDDEMELSSY